MHLLLTDTSSIITPLNREIKLNAKDIIISRTDTQGNILFYNKIFAKVSGYSRDELLYAPHSILRHPDMPKAIFYLLWQQLLAGIPTKAIIKNISKEGDHYWLTLNLTPLRDNSYKIVSFTAQGSQASQFAIDKVAPLYAKILEEEKQHDMHHSIRFLSDYLIEQNIASYNDYVHKITEKRPKGLLFPFRI